MAKENYIVIGLARSYKNSKNNAFDNVTHLGCDITNLDEVKKVFKFIEANFGQIDVLVNNAGSGTVATIEDISYSDLESEIKINLLGHIYCIKESIPLLRKNKGGLILNITSTGGRLTYPSIAIYDACKHAIESISYSLSWELEKWNIKVSILEPGAINTNFGKRMKRYNNSDRYIDYYSSASRGFGKMYKNSQTPEKVATFVLALLKQYKWRQNTSFLDKIWILSFILLPKKTCDFIIKRYFN